MQRAPNAGSATRNAEVSENMADRRRKPKDCGGLLLIPAFGGPMRPDTGFAREAVGGAKRGLHCAWGTWIVGRNITGCDVRSFERIDASR